MNRWDFVIIGGGIAGVSLAAELAPCGRTLVLEQESALGYHATGRSAAIVVPNYGAPPLRALTQASLPTLLEIEVDGHLLAHRKGSLMLELPGQEGVLQASLEDPDRQGRMHEVTLDEALQRVPILRREAIVRAGWEPDVWALDADGLLQWYRRRARAAGAEFRLNAKVTALERVGDVWQVTAGGATLLGFSSTGTGTPAWSTSLPNCSSDGGGGTFTDATPSVKSTADIQFIDWDMAGGPSKTTISLFTAQCHLSNQMGRALLLPPEPRSHCWAI